MCLFKEFKRNFTNLMNHEKKTCGRDWPGENSSCKRKKKISQGWQVRGKSGQVCIWLNSLLRGVMKVVKTNLYLEKSPLKNIKRSKVKRGLKRYKVGKNRFQVMEESKWELFLLNALLSNFMISCVGTDYMHRYESRTHYQFLNSGSKQHVAVNIRNSLT